MDREEVKPPDSSITSGVSNGDRLVRVRYRFKDAEFEAEGPAEIVSQHAGAFFSVLAQSTALAKPNGDTQLPQLEGNNMPLLSDNGMQEGTTLSNGANHSTISLEAFYLSVGWDASEGKSKLGQAQQILVITHYLAKFRQLECVTTADYAQAYAELDRLPVKMKKGFLTRLSELVRGESLRKVGKGYALTHKGEQSVASLISAK